MSMAKKITESPEDLRESYNILYRYWGNPRLAREDRRITKIAGHPNVPVDVQEHIAKNIKPMSRGGNVGPVEKLAQKTRVPHIQVWLTKNPATNVRWQLACNKNLCQEARDIVAKDTSGKVLSGLIVSGRAFSDEIPVMVDRVGYKSAWFTRAVAQKTENIEILKSLLDSQDITFPDKETLAHTTHKLLDISTPNVDSDILTRLATHESKIVRDIVKNHPNTPIEYKVLTELSSG